MPKPFLISLIAVSANLVAMVVVYSLMANALARLHWHRRGAIGVMATIFVAGLFWIVPPFALALGDLSAPPSALWLGNWLVSGCGVVILCQRVRWIPRELEDQARMDGCSWLGIYRHVVLPLVRRELVLIALLTVMATSILFWAVFAAHAFCRELPDSPPWLYLLLPPGAEHGPSPAGIWLAMITGSLVMTLPVILIFLFAKRYPQSTADTAGIGSTSTAG
jgi:ABC-type glycerol-3-phosphate transport system permease component